MELSKEQEEILRLLTQEFLTVKQISLRRKTSLRAVYYTIDKLVKKGVLFYQSEGGVHIGEGTQNRPAFKLFKPCGQEKEKDFKPCASQIFKTIRLHNQHFTIRIINKSEGYQSFRHQVTSFKFDGNTVKLNEDNVEVYANKSFVSSGDPKLAHADSMVYWNNYFLRLQHELKVILIKPGVDNVREVNSHYAECDNELAKDFHLRRDKLSVVGEDGKQWLKIDNSFNLREIEAVHSKFSIEDIEKIATFFSDLRLHDPMRMSDIIQTLGSQAKIVLELMETCKVTCTSVGILMELMKPLKEAEVNQTLNLLKELKDKLTPKDDGSKPDMNKKIPDYIN